MEQPQAAVLRAAVLAHLAVAELSSDSSQTRRADGMNRFYIASEVLSAATIRTRTLPSTGKAICMAQRCTAAARDAGVFLSTDAAQYSNLSHNRTGRGSRAQSTNSQVDLTTL